MADPPGGHRPEPRTWVRWLGAHRSIWLAAVLDLLIDQTEPCTVMDLPALAPQQPNAIREHLGALVGHRLTTRTRAPARGRGRPPWHYRSEPEVAFGQGAPEYAAPSRNLAAPIARSIRHPRADCVKAGRRWGRGLMRRSPRTVVESWVEAVAAGPVQGSFASSPDALNTTVQLRRSPLLEAAEQNPEVMGGIHLGILPGALQGLGGVPERIERTALQPLSQTLPCRLEMLPCGGTP